MCLALCPDWRRGIEPLADDPRASAPPATGAGHERPESGEALRRRLTGITLATLALRGGAVGLTFLVNVWAARLLGVRGYGLFALVLAWSFVLAVPASLGFDRLLLREFAKMRGRWDPSAARSLLRTARLATGAASAGAAGVVVLAAFVVGDSDPGGSFGAIVLGALLVPLLTLTSIHIAAIQGLHRVARGLLPESLIRPAVLLLLLVGAAIWWRDPPPVAGTLLLVLASLAGLIVAVSLWRAVDPGIASRGSGRAVTSAPRAIDEPRGPWLRAALPLAVLSMVTIVSGQADVVLVGLLLDPEAAGRYAIALRVSLLVNFPLIVVSAALAPTYAWLIATGQAGRLQKLVTVTTRAAGAVAVVLSIAFLVVGGDILALFGPEFRAGAPAFAILVVGQLLNAITGPTGSMMFFGGFERRQALSVGVGAAVEMLLVALLVCPLGLAGAAIGSTVGQFVWNALMVLHVRRRLGIRTTVVGL